MVGGSTTVVVVVAAIVVVVAGGFVGGVVVARFGGVVGEVPPLGGGVHPPSPVPVCRVPVERVVVDVVVVPCRRVVDVLVVADLTDAVGAGDETTSFLT